MHNHSLVFFLVEFCLVGFGVNLLFGLDKWINDLFFWVVDMG